jgi:hypothetical protein
MRVIKKQSRTAVRMEPVYRLEESGHCGGDAVDLPEMRVTAN